MAILRWFRIHFMVMSAGVLTASLLSTILHGADCVDRCLHDDVHALSGGPDGYKYSALGCNADVESCLGTSPFCVTTANCQQISGTDDQYYCQWMNRTCDNPAQAWVQGKIDAQLNCEVISQPVPKWRCVKTGE
jgi:hypothetical protein